MRLWACGGRRRARPASGLPRGRGLAGWLRACKACKVGCGLLKAKWAAGLPGGRIRVAGRRPVRLLLLGCVGRGRRRACRKGRGLAGWRRACRATVSSSGQACAGVDGSGCSAKSILCQRFLLKPHHGLHFRLKLRHRFNFEFKLRHRLDFRLKPRHKLDFAEVYLRFCQGSRFRVDVSGENIDKDWISENATCGFAREIQFMLTFQARTSTQD